MRDSTTNILPWRHKLRQSSSSSSPLRHSITLKSKETHNTALAHHKMYYGLCKIKNTENSILFRRNNNKRASWKSENLLNREGEGATESGKKDLPTNLAVNLHHLLDFYFPCLPSKHPPSWMCTNICWFTLNFHWGIKTHLHCKY